MSGSVTDEIGFNTLDSFSAAMKFNSWMAGIIDPWCKGEILEIGGGIGNISLFFLQEGKYLTITELREEYLQVLKKRLNGYPTLVDIIQMDITDLQFNEKFGALFGSFNTVYALNVIEHIEDRELAVQNCRKLLKEGGNLIVLVPAFQCLYNRLDSELGHYLRFNHKELSLLLERNGFRVSHRRYFNAAAMAGWWVAGTILKKKMIPGGSMKIYNLLVPLFRILDLFTHKLVGISIIQVAVKAPAL